MVIDHVGTIFFPDLLWMRMFGRLTFPIFAWMISLCYYNTGNVYKYALRLVILWIISQIPYGFLFEGLNVITTLILGLACIYIFDKINNKKLSLIIISIISIIVTLLDFD